MHKVLALLALVGACVFADDAPNNYNAAPAPAAPASAATAYRQQPQQQQSAYQQQPTYEDAPAKYNFDWAVKDDPSYNNYGQQEQRDGDNTDGTYTVLLPDGRVQTVKYYVNGDSGYVAEVSYSGEARYDAAPVPAPSNYQKPSYAPPPPPAAAPQYSRAAPAPAQAQQASYYNPAPSAVAASAVAQQPLAYEPAAPVPAPSSRYEPAAAAQAEQPNEAAQYEAPAPASAYSGNKVARVASYNNPAPQPAQQEEYPPQDQYSA